MARAKSGNGEGRHRARPKNKAENGELATNGPAKRLCLTFENIDRFETVTDPIHRDLSTATRHGDVLFMSCDETAGIDRLVPDGSGYGRHRHFNIGQWIDLPDGPDGEMDIEGMDVDGNWLWVVGSHSLKRDKPGDDDDPDQALAAMARVKRDPNRAFLGRVPLADLGDGPEPVGRDGDRCVQTVRLHGKRSTLKKWLRGDPHAGAFLDLPSKENGFDIEGIAARGMRVWLGLRGPVLRERAVILELEMKVTGSGHLKARRIDGKRRYRKHLIPTAGQGVRDLAFDGADLVILTGTAMAGDGPAEMLRWREPAGVVASGLVPADRVERLGQLPYRGQHDHPEGICRWHDGAWFVVHDNPHPDRVQDRPARVQADLWQF